MLHRPATHAIRKQSTTHIHCIKIGSFILTFSNQNGSSDANKREQFEFFSFLFASHFDLCECEKSWRGNFIPDNTASVYFIIIFCCCWVFVPEWDDKELATLKIVSPLCDQTIKRTAQPLRSRHWFFFCHFFYDCLFYCAKFPCMVWLSLGALPLSHLFIYIIYYDMHIFALQYEIVTHDANDDDDGFSLSLSLPSLFVLFGLTFIWIL